MLIQGYFLLFILAFLLGGIAAVRKDRRFLVMAGGVLFLMGGIIGATGVQVKTGTIQTGTENVTVNSTMGGEEVQTHVFNITVQDTFRDVSNGTGFSGTGLNTILVIMFVFAGLLAIMVGVFVPGSAYTGRGVLRGG